MSALATAPAAATGSRTDPPARWHDLIGAEWIKIRSLRSNVIILSILILLALVCAYRQAGAEVSVYPAFRHWPRWKADPGSGDFAPFPYNLLMIGAGVFGGLTLLGEYSSGLIRVGVTAVPARGRVMAAKAAALAAVLGAVGLLVGIASWAIADARYANRSSGLVFANEGALRTILATGLVFPVCGLIGLAAAALFRNTALAVFMIIAYVDLLPVVAVVPDRVLHTGKFFERIGDHLPWYAWDRLVSLTPSGTSALLNPEEAWIWLIGWAIVSVLLAMTALRRRDL